MTSAIPGKQARTVVLMTGVMAFISIAVASILAVRLSSARATLQRELQACACCQDLQPGMKN